MWSHISWGYSAIELAELLKTAGKDSAVSTAGIQIWEDNSPFSLCSTLFSPILKQREREIFQNRASWPCPRGSGGDTWVSKVGWHTANNTWVLTTAELLPRFCQGCRCRVGEQVKWGSEGADLSKAALVGVRQPALWSQGTVSKCHLCPGLVCIHGITSPNKAAFSRGRHNGGAGRAQWGVNSCPGNAAFQHQLLMCGACCWGLARAEQGNILAYFMRQKQNDFQQNNGQA